MKRTFLKIGLAALAALCGGAALAQQAWPNKPIKVVIGFPPGTIMDGVARPVTEEMGKRLGQPFVIEFKPGAGSTIAAKHVATAEPDGYTLLFSAASAILPVLNRTNGIDSGKELTSVAHLASAPFFVLARGDLPFSTVKELVAYVKENPGKLTHGVGTPSAELVMQTFQSRTGAKSRSIPYKGSVHALQAMLAGDVDMGVGTVAAFLPHMKTGKIRALTVMSPQRSPLAPDVPTTAELGIPNLVIGTNLGLWAPPNTPPEIVQKLSVAAREALVQPSVIERIRSGAAAEPSTTPSAQDQLRIYETEKKTWADAAKLANFKAP